MAKERGKKGESIRTCALSLSPLCYFKSKALGTLSPEGAEPAEAALVQLEIVEKSRDGHRRYGIAAKVGNTLTHPWGRQFP